MNWIYKIHGSEEGCLDQNRILRSKQDFKKLLAKNPRPWILRRKPGFTGVLPANIPQPREYSYHELEQVIGHDDESGEEPTIDSPLIGDVIVHVCLNDKFFE